PLLPGDVFQDRLPGHGKKTGLQSRRHLQHRNPRAADRPQQHETRDPARQNALNVRFHGDRLGRRQAEPSGQCRQPGQDHLLGSRLVASSARLTLTTPGQNATGLLNQAARSSCVRHRTRNQATLHRVRALSSLEPGPIGPSLATAWIWPVRPMRYAIPEPDSAGNPATGTQISGKAITVSIFMAHQGSEDNGQLWYNTFDGQTWAGDQQVPDTGM